MKSLIKRCSRSLLAAARAPAARARGAQRLRLRARMGVARARSSAATRSTSRRDDGAAGPASDRSAAEPDRAHAQRRPARLHRRGARDRLAAAADPAVGQPAHRAGAPANFEAGRFVHAARGADAARPQRGRRPRRRQSAHPARPAQHRARSPTALGGAAGAARRRQRGDLPAARSPTFSARWSAAMRKWEQQARRCAACRWSSHHKNMTYLWNWLGMQRGRRRCEPKPGVEPSGALPERRCYAQLAAAAGEDGRPRRLRGPARLAVAVGARQASRPSMLPFTVGGNDKAKDLFGLFDDTHRAAARRGAAQ